VEPTLANDLIHASVALEQASNRDAGSSDVSTSFDQQLTMEQVAQHHRRLAKEWETLVKRAQSIPGFEDFLRPKKLVQLWRAAQAGPVVVANVDKHRCDALVLMAGLDEVIHIPLDCFSYEKADKLHQSLNELLSAARVRTGDTRHMKCLPNTTSANFSSILSDTWSYVVKPVLDVLALSVGCSLLHRLLD